MHQPGTNERRGWLYLITGIGRPVVRLPADPRPKPIELNQPKAKVEPCLLVGGIDPEDAPELDSMDGRYVARFPYHRRDDPAAQRIADALDGTLNLLGAPVLRQHAIAIGFPRSLEYSSGLVKRRSGVMPDCGLAVRRVDLMIYDRLRQDDQAIGYVMMRSLLEDCVQVPELKPALEILPVTVRSPYFEAVHFYRESVTHFDFVGPTIQEILVDPTRAPVTQVERVKVEAAAWNAFKALEAIIGDPPKDERKFRSKLMARGIDPDLKMGYEPWFLSGSALEDERREPTAVKIRKMSSCRDKRSAHGSRTTSDRTITYCELMDFQACTRICLLSAIEAELKEIRGGVHEGLLE
jgi:hypothetical protein